MPRLGHRGRYPTEMIVLRSHAEMENPYESSMTDSELTAIKLRPRTIYHFTSIVTGLAWMTVICYAIKVFHETGATIAPPYYSGAVQASVIVSLIIWSAFVRTWAGDSRRLCVVFTLSLIGIQVLAIFTMGR